MEYNDEHDINGSLVVGLYNGEYSIAIGLTKLQQNGMMDDDVHINGWHPYPTKFGN